MGLIMEKVRGKAEAKMVSEVLKRKLKEAVE
jgi:Glu-tRNA(Gln) amidotransferase subunit E-like FAD-binding protein